MLQAQRSQQLTSGSLFQMRKVSHQLGGDFSLQQIQLDIDHSEIVFITGPSGAGKTTLLKILAGDINPQQGIVVVNDGVVRKDFFISCIYQDLRLIESLSIKDNLYLAYRPEAFKNFHDFERELQQLVKILNVNDRMGLKVKDANGGLKQKVAIIRSLLGRPNVILADEPTSSLDLEQTLKIYQLFEHYQKNMKMSIVWASHQRELVQRFSGRIIHLDVGRLVYAGKACFI